MLLFILLFKILNMACVVDANIPESAFSENHNFAYSSAQNPCLQTTGNLSLFFAPTFIQYFQRDEVETPDLHPIIRTKEIYLLFEAKKVFHINFVVPLVHSP